MGIHKNPWGQVSRRRQNLFKPSSRAPLGTDTRRSKRTTPLPFRLRGSLTSAPQSVSRPWPFRQGPCAPSLALSVAWTLLGREGARVVRVRGYLSPMPSVTGAPEGLGHRGQASSPSAPLWPCLWPWRPRRWPLRAPPGALELGHMRTCSQELSWMPIAQFVLSLYIVLTGLWAWHRPSDDRLAIMTVAGTPGVECCMRRRFLSGVGWRSSAMPVPDPFHDLCFARPFVSRCFECVRALDVLRRCISSHTALPGLW